MTAASAAVINSEGLVENVIVVDADAEMNTTFVYPDSSRTVKVLPMGSPVAIGYTYDFDSGEYTAPEPTEEAAE